MGLTHHSVGTHAVDVGLHIERRTPHDKVIALAGNPNVGKSTLFNNLTGLNQHTGNWPGKTVCCAQGFCKAGEARLALVDLPGTYSLMAHSAEEAVARDFICFGDADAVVVVCDATCLERNLNLALQIMEVTRNVVICVNLIDEAEKKGIHIDVDALSAALGVPVVGTVARQKGGLQPLVNAMVAACEHTSIPARFSIRYTDEIESAIDTILPFVWQYVRNKIDARWVSLRLLDADDALAGALADYLGYDVMADAIVANRIRIAKQQLHIGGFSDLALGDGVVSCIVRSAEQLCATAVRYGTRTYNETDRRIDRILTSKRTGFPIMLALLALVFWLTIAGANYPSQLLSDALFWIEDGLTALFAYCNAPSWLHGMLVLGIYRVLAWVVSVMLPPMAIFFPLFTLLEDAGYLPRVAFNLDKYFKKCCACGKQALTTCMGFGCNAAGVVGCRIIDSPRERLIAILTNNFVPCNGRFPALIAILAMFFVGGAGGLWGAALSALLLTLVIVLSIGITFVASKLLSVTILKGVPSSFTLELPPYRRPEIGKVIVRSMLDRTLFVLSRAAAVAAPAGLVIWIMANVRVYDASLLHHCANFLDPFARCIGLDGVILFAFILGFPANEIVIPIVIMGYLSGGTLVELDSLSSLRALLVANGWTWITAACFMLFSLMHWPCSTTLLTIHKETGSVKWTAVAFAVPTILGVAACFVCATIARCFV